MDLRSRERSLFHELKWPDVHDLTERFLEIFFVFIHGLTAGDIEMVSSGHIGNLLHQIGVRPSTRLMVKTG